MSLRHALLGFLSIRPLSGYDLKRYFDASVRHFWTADQAAIYRALSDLESESLVRHERIAQSSRPDRKVFHLTDAGRTALDAWLATPTPSNPRREPLLVQLFFAGRLAPEAFRELLHAELAATEAELAGFRGIVAAIAAEQASLDEATQVGPLITIVNGVRAALAQRDWLQGLLARQEAGALTVADLLEELRTLLDERAA
jgi:PadR family transcriptional regulator, regulatory protein AphA